MLLKGQYYSNNSIINVNDIGTASEALFCFTKEHQCCRSQDNFIAGHRDWYFPGGLVVVNNKTTNSIYGTRGPRSVILHRDNVVSPTGIYRCQLYTENTYIGIYNASQGKNNDIHSDSHYYIIIEALIFTKICLIVR